MLNGKENLFRPHFSLQSSNKGTTFFFHLCKFGWLSSFKLINKVLSINSWKRKTSLHLYHDEVWIMRKFESMSKPFPNHCSKANSFNYAKEKKRKKTSQSLIQKSHSLPKMKGWYEGRVYNPMSFSVETFTFFFLILLNTVDFLKNRSMKLFLLLHSRVSKFYNSSEVGIWTSDL